MLAEWFKHQLIPAPRHLKDMGYVKELIAIGARHRRCQDAWADHLGLCKKVILDAAKGIKPDKVTILGSGLLLDIPIDALSKTFGEVVLVDIFHMPEIKKCVKPMKNVRLEAIDVTGVVEATFEHALEGALPPAKADAGWLADSDLVVSANILSQLPLLPMDWVKDKGYGEEKTEAFARRIIDHHLELLGALPGRVCLLTEFERQIADGDEVLQEIDPLFGARIPASGLKWIWNIAPRPEITRHIDLRFRMTGIPDLRAVTGKGKN
ncbi:MAG: hypothetical protein HQ512_07955 [Rhodospirillales bacterium]|nr:hypothetical protein [Rhodospirillales bacterium]